MFLKNTASTVELLLTFTFAIFKSFQISCKRKTTLHSEELVIWIVRSTTKNRKHHRATILFPERKEELWLPTSTNTWIVILKEEIVSIKLQSLHYGNPYTFYPVVGFALWPLNHPQIRIFPPTNCIILLPKSSVHIRNDARKQTSKTTNNSSLLPN